MTGYSKHNYGFGSLVITVQSHKQGFWKVLVSSQLNNWLAAIIHSGVHASASLSWNKKKSGFF